MIFLWDVFFHGTRYSNWQQPKTFSASKSVLHAIIDNDLREANWKCCTPVCILFSLFFTEYQIGLNCVYTLLSFLDRIPNWLNWSNFSNDRLPNWLYFH